MLNKETFIRIVMVMVKEETLGKKDEFNKFVLDQGYEVIGSQYELLNSLGKDLNTKELFENVHAILFKMPSDSYFEEITKKAEESIKDPERRKEIEKTSSFTKKQTK